MLTRDLVNQLNQTISFVRANSGNDTEPEIEDLITVRGEPIKITPENVYRTRRLRYGISFL